MSDGEYDPAAEDDFEADETLGSVAADEPETDLDSEDLGLDEDAAGSDGSESEEDGPGLTDDEGQAKPARPNPNPPQKKSNNPTMAVIVGADERVTDHCLRRTEAALILAMRAQQIAQFSTSFTSHEGLHNPVDIAYKELLERRCPLNLRRFVGTGAAGELLYEEWDVNTMTLPPLVPPGPWKKAV
jgi:DNA-directed RNA polymerase subunit K/omega